MAERKLTPKQEAFAREYPTDLDATAAARRAGYSERTAGQIGYQLLQKTSVREAIALALAARAERCELTADLVVEGLLAEARFTGDGSSHGARVSAWGLLGQHVGMFKQVKEVRKRVVIKVLRGASLDDL